MAKHKGRSDADGDDAGIDINGDSNIVNPGARSVNITGKKNRIKKFVHNPQPETSAPKQHTILPDKSFRTPITETVNLWFSILASAATIASAAFATTTGQIILQSTEARTKSINWIIFIVILALLSICGWAFYAWIRREVYSERTFFGRVAEGARDETGKLRLYFTRLRGTCAIDGSVMKARNVPIESITTTWEDGSSKERVTKRELRLVCQRNPSDAAHHAKVDIALT